MSDIDPFDGRAETIGDFFRLLRLDAREATLFPAAFEHLRRGDLTGIIVTGVHEPAFLAGLVHRLERGAPPFLRTSFPPEFRSHFLGRALDLTDPSLAGYFADARDFEDHLAAAFPPPLDIPGRVFGVLSALDGGRPFLAPPGPAPGERYFSTTIRVHQPGGYIPPHCENEQLDRPSYHHLRSLVEPQIMSFVLALSIAGAGGALEIFEYRFEQALGASMMRGDRTCIAPIVEDLASVKLRIPPGAMVIFDGGRFLHQLTPVEGTSNRWTVSSFMALSRDHRAMYCWG